MSEDRTPYNAANPKDIKKAKHKEKDAAEQALDDMKAVLAMPEGRRIFAGLLAEFKIAQLEWRPGAEINRNVGIYECANHILGRIVKADPELGAKMLTEAYVKEIKNGNL